MITKLAVFNDRNVPMNVRMMGGSYNPDTSQEYIIIPPQSHKLLELEIPEGSTPWFKLWENNTALFSYVSAGIQL